MSGQRYTLRNLRTGAVLVQRATYAEMMVAVQVAVRADPNARLEVSVSAAKPQPDAARDTDGSGGAA